MDAFTMKNLPPLKQRMMVSPPVRVKAAQYETVGGKNETLVSMAIEIEDMGFGEVYEGVPIGGDINPPPLVLRNDEFIALVDFSACEAVFIRLGERLVSASR